MINLITVNSVTISDCVPLLQVLYGFLSPREKKQSNRFVTTLLRQRYIITRAVLRVLLGKYLGMSPGSIQFSINTFGRPFIMGSRLSFNMSHSLDKVYYAISDGIIVGIDVEFLNLSKDIHEIAKSVFSFHEFGFFSSLSKIDRRDFFFSTWTKKEAIVKAMGMGLYFPMELVDTLQVSDECLYIGDDYYCLRVLGVNDSTYKAHLAVRNDSKVLIKECTLSVSDISV